MRLLVLIFIFSAFASTAQQLNNNFTAPITSLYSDTTPNLDLLPKKKRDFKMKEKKIPKTVFYGIKTKRGYTITGKGKGKVIELFYYIPKWKDPDQYVPVVYWFNLKKKKVMNTPILEKDQKYARLLHGPYLKKTSYSIVEDGIFYVGSKHGRWEKYDANDVLVEKIKYFRGWTRESLISYYDQDRKKIQEIVPIINGSKTGKYYRYFESGHIAEEGTYAEGNKIGQWFEYYDDRKKRKKIIQYPKDAYDTTTQPVLLKEWDTTGKLIYDKASKEQLGKQNEKSKKKK
ncbi:MAG TPA: hypothetical protein DCR46_02280 [Cytophagales bacterium]|nr:hypothetical protein [Cytophagales bacterium]